MKTNSSQRFRLLPPYGEQDIEYVIKFIDRDKEVGHRGYQSLRHAKCLYYRLLTSVLQNTYVQDGKDCRFLVWCCLYRVSPDDLDHAIRQVGSRSANRVLDSDDPYLGPPVAVRDLFRKLH